MTNVAHPTDAKRVVALFCTRGMEAFLSNALQGMLRVGVDPGQIHVGCPDNVLSIVSSVAKRHSSKIHVISIRNVSENAGGLETYARHGSRLSTEISWKKMSFIKDLVELHPHVVYSDVDVAWIRNPLPYLSQVALVYPMAFQTEGLPRFPPAICCGFASFLRSARTIAFLDALIEFDSTQAHNDDRLPDQAACQRLIESDSAWLRDIYCLPEALFPNGLEFGNLQSAGQSPCPMEGELLPFIFHANWTVGLDNKRSLLARTGNWLVGDIPPFNPKTGGSSVESAPQTEQRATVAADAPLLSVIYPVFDTRGDAIDRIRLWTEEQDIDPGRYCVIVVAGADMELDDARLRKILRAQDVILRVPGVGRDADYWNVGARQATTPWLLFVEAHGVPRRDSLSALAAWIAATSDGEACNFRIENHASHRVAKLMKRWFGEILSDLGRPFDLAPPASHSFRNAP